MKKLFKEITFPDRTKKKINKVGDYIEIKGKKVKVYSNPNTITNNKMKLKQVIIKPLDNTITKGEKKRRKE